MAAATGVNTVWIGFMDIVPVIGSIKEAVELVLAVYEGNEALIKRKEKAVKDFVKKSLEMHLKLGDSEVDYYLPDERGAGAAALSELPGLKNVKEVRIETIIECVTKGSKKGAKLTPEQRKKRVKEIQNETLEKIRRIKPDFNQDLREQLGRSKRGEHVFNNSILRFHSDVLNEFTRRYIYNLRGYDESTLKPLGRHTLDRNTVEEIQDKMVVHFDDDEFYVNANSLAYGQYRQALCDALLDILGHIKQSDVTKNEIKRLNCVIDNMNNNEIYVDKLAKEKWIDNSDRRIRFENVKREVVTMYREHRSFNWCCDILRQVQPLFGNRQFPKEIQLRKQWEEALRREGFTADESSRLCSEHFRQEDFDSCVSSIN